MKPELPLERQAIRMINPPALLDLCAHETWTPPATRDVTGPEPPAVLFGLYAERVVATRVSRRGRPLARRTADSYNYLLREHINPTFEETPVTRITPEMVRDWYSDVARVRARGAKVRRRRRLCAYYTRTRL
ncbi:hypothetical protein ACTWPB_22720 [Nocardia sp. IBHARD005]|uniref:hypothetical protein n=1 Tax=Nocardia sp. IBHARD005 TaxID=3457765 RepID=UPI0040597C99